MIRSVQYEIRIIIQIHKLEYYKSGKIINKYRARIRSRVSGRKFNKNEKYY